MLRLTNLSVPLDYDDAILRALLLKKLKLSSDQLLSFHVSRRSVDARNKQDVHFVLSIDLTLKNEQSALRRNKNLSLIQPPRSSENHASSFVLSGAWFIASEDSEDSDAAGSASIADPSSMPADAALASISSS